jgi:hypothetical protein
MLFGTNYDIALLKLLSMKLIDRLRQFTATSYADYHIKSFEGSSESKFILGAKELNKVLEEIKDLYFIVEIEGKRIFKYTSEYFDTEDYSLYMAHHNGNADRYLIKSNEIEGLRDRLFEIKHKSNKGEMFKHKASENSNGKISELIQQKTPFEPGSLKKMLENQFYRIILIHKTLGEKVTIDLDLQLSDINHKIKLPYLAIVELRQKKYSFSSDFVLSLRRHNIQKTSLNRYCIGVALLNKNVKKNKFKAKLLAIHKINENEPHPEYIAV